VVPLSCALDEPSIQANHFVTYWSGIMQMSINTVFLFLAHPERC